MASVATAEADAEATYLGAVRALAAALDARDPYTAGHSERVSRFAVAMGEELKLDGEALETLRLGALLHDIGKIGVPDEVLRKPGVLSAAEFESIKTHPVAGARILRSIPFLASHIPIVELHHERPDGLGYPYGLRGDEIPLAARIVHVADAFDAMTSARAYRSGRIPVEAIAELRKCVGTDFDAASVEALIAAVPRLVGTAEPQSPAVFQWAHRARSA
jgi:putative nucleotidyltransferase with HDIG domain